MPLSLKPIVRLAPGFMAWRRHQLIRRYVPLQRPWDAGYLDRKLGILRLSGSWRDIGRAVAKIGGANAFVTETLASFSRLPAHRQETLREQAEQAYARAVKFIPQLSDLLDGAVEVTSVPHRDVVLAHCITAVSASIRSRSCGAIGWMTEHGPVIAQALDLGLTNDTAAVLLEPANGKRVLCHMNVGTFWFSTGVNSSGVVIGGASVNVRADHGARGACFVHPFVEFLVLSGAASRTEAIELLSAARPFGGPGEGSTHLIADPASMSVVEIAGDRIEHETHRRAVVGNHFVLEDMPELEEPAGDAARCRRFSVSRRQSALSMLDTNTSGSVDTLTEFMEMGNRADSWNRSAVPPDDGWTTSRYIIDVPNGRFTTWQGPRPADPRPHTVPLSALFAGHLGG